MENENNNEREEVTYQSESQNGTMENMGTVNDSKENIPVQNEEMTEVTPSDLNTNMQDQNLQETTIQNQATQHLMNTDVSQRDWAQQNSSIQQEQQQDWTQQNADIQQDPSQNETAVPFSESQNSREVPQNQEISQSQQIQYSQANPNGQGIPYSQSTNADNGQATVKQTKKKEKKKGSGGKAKKVVGFAASAAAFGLIAGGVMVGVNTAGNRLLGNSDTRTTEVATVTTTDPGMAVSSSESGIADVAENVMPSIVSISNKSVQTVRSWFQSYEQEVIGSGSGIIIGQTKDEIMVVTNNHVIDGAEEITVTFCNQASVAATVKGADSTADLAVLTVKTADIEPETLKEIKVAALGSSDNLRVGDRVIAIGNALGYGQSLTGGFVSALNREVDMEDKTMKLLQTDAAINPGNSGGALLNDKGEVIGINTVKLVESTVEGMGYAIPISSAIPIINDLMNQQVIKEEEQGYLGIRGRDITDEYAEDFNMPKGVYVLKIVENSPADQCELKAGDIITKFANRDVSTMENLQNLLSNKKAGEEVEMTVQRSNDKGEYEEINLKVILGAKKDIPSEEKETTEEQRSGNRRESQNGEEQLPYDDRDDWNENPYEQIPDEFYDYFFRY